MLYVTRMNERYEVRCAVPSTAHVADLLHDLSERFHVDIHYLLLVELISNYIYNIYTERQVFL